MPFKKNNIANPNGRPKLLLNSECKTCSECNDNKVLNQFSKNGNYKNGLPSYRSVCKSCYNKNWKYRLMSTMISRESSTKRAGGNGYSNIKVRDKSINLKYLETLKINQNGLCHWLKIPIDFSMNDKLRKPSLDRLDNSLGYVPGNVVLTTLFANLGRRDATIKEMKNFIDIFLFAQKKFN